MDIRSDLRRWYVFRESGYLFRIVAIVRVRESGYLFRFVVMVRV